MLSDPNTTAGITSAALTKHGIVAVFGAVVHSLNAYRNGGSKSFIDMLMLTIISSFSGVMFAFVAFHVFGEESYLTLAIAGSGGFLGVEGMSMLTRALKKSILANIQK